MGKLRKRMHASCCAYLRSRCDPAPVEAGLCEANERLAQDCDRAAQVLQDRGAFLTGQGILRQAAAALRASACKGEVKTGDGWQGIDSAPYDTPVLVKLGEGMSIVAVLRLDASEGEDGPCDQWQAHHEDEHPECWSGGACWGSNDNGVPSMQPTHWTPAALAAPEGEA